MAFISQKIYIVAWSTQYFQTPLALGFNGNIIFYQRRAQYYLKMIYYFLKLPLRKSSCWLRSGYLWLSDIQDAKITQLKQEKKKSPSRLEIIHLMSHFFPTFFLSNSPWSSLAFAILSCRCQSNIKILKGKLMSFNLTSSLIFPWFLLSYRTSFFSASFWKFTCTRFPSV